MVPSHDDEAGQPSTEEQLRALRVFTQGLKMELVARAKVGAHATADGNKMAAALHTLACRGKRILPPVMKKKA